jgi:hypothetical protein
MRLLTVQVLGVLLLGYQGAATPTDANTFAGNDDGVDPDTAALTKVSVKHNKTAVTTLRQDRLRTELAAELGWRSAGVASLHFCLLASGK